MFCQNNCRTPTLEERRCQSWFAPKTRLDFMLQIHFPGNVVCPPKDAHEAFDRARLHSLDRPEDLSISNHRISTAFDAICITHLVDHREPLFQVDSVYFTTSTDRIRAGTRIFAPAGWQGVVTSTITGVVRKLPNTIVLEATGQEGVINVGISSVLYNSEPLRETGHRADYTRETSDLTLNQGQADVQASADLFLGYYKIADTSKKLSTNSVTLNRTNLPPTSSVTSRERLSITHLLNPVNPNTTQPPLATSVQLSHPDLNETWSTLVTRALSESANGTGTVSDVHRKLIARFPWFKEHWSERRCKRRITETLSSHKEFISLRHPVQSGHGKGRGRLWMIDYSRGRGKVHNHNGKKKETQPPRTWKFGRKKPQT
ncbi:hypothetical protein DFH06DRAFT_1132797 [Mycena polygramma]|nr:hypothetical protein DFH06DRAFT_1132797 [Mycena polygramma]